MKAIPKFAKYTPLAAIAILLSLLSSAFAQTNSGRGIGIRALPNPAKRFAIIIGVDQYKNGQVTPLKGASNDAGTLATSLINYAGFPQNQVYVLTTDQPEDQQPTRAVILDRLAKLAGRATQDSLLLVFFAGHGMERNKEVFLLPSDVQDSALEDTALTSSKIKERILKTGARQIILILDTCRNDPMAGRANADNLLTTSFTKSFDFDTQNREVEAYVTLYSTSSGQRAYEYSQKRQGFFTWALVEGLRGAAADKRGTITLAQLLKYVEEVVPNLVRQELGPARGQKPWHTIEGFRAEELVISITPTPAISEPAEKDLAELRNWQKIKTSKNPEDVKRHLDLYPDGNFAEQARSQLQALSPRPSSPPSNTTAANVTSLVKAPLEEFENPELIGKRDINKNQSKSYSFDKEVVVGRQYAQYIDRGTKLIDYDDRVLVEYVNRVGQNMVLHSDAKVPFTIKVIDDDIIGAIALPGGFLYVNKGLLLAADNEAEFAAALARMIAHIAARHGIKAAGYPNPNNLGSLPTISEPEWGGAAIPRAFVLFSKEAVEEADRLAAQYLWATGYNPNGLVTFFGKFKQKESSGISRISGAPYWTAGQIEKIKGLIERFPPRSQYTNDRPEFQAVKNRLVAPTNLRKK